MQDKVLITWAIIWLLLEGLHSCLKAKESHGYSFPRKKLKTKIRARF